MAYQNIADELENEIVSMEQELILKRTFLEECRQKLQQEMSEHKQTKSLLNKHVSENKELRIQLNINLTGTEKLQSEFYKNRETMVKLQVQMDSYLEERQQLLDRCYNTEVENINLKNDVTDLKEQLSGHNAFQEKCKTKTVQTQSLLNEIISKQEILSKEQQELERACKEALQFAKKVAEEADFQARFVREANESQIRLEDQILRLIVQLEKNKNKEEIEFTNTTDQEVSPYLIEWKSYQEQTNERIKDLMEENVKLSEELELATSHIQNLLQQKK